MSHSNAILLRRAWLIPAHHGGSADPTQLLLALPCFWDSSVCSGCLWNGAHGYRGCPGQLCCSISEHSSKGICWDLKQSAEWCDLSRDRRWAAQGPQTCSLETLPMNTRGLCTSFSCWTLSITGVWALLCPHNSSIVGLAVLAWHTLSSVCEGSGLWRLSGGCLTPGHPLASPLRRRAEQKLPHSWVLFLTTSLPPYPSIFHSMASLLTLNKGSSHPPSLGRGICLCIPMEGRSAGKVIAEVASCPDHSAWGPAPPSYPCGCAPLPTGDTWSSPAQMCLDSLIQLPPCCLSQQPGPFGDMLSLPKATQGLGTPIVVIPALPWGVPQHGLSPWCVGGSVHVGLLQPHGMLSTAGLQPLPCTLL